MRRPRARSMVGEELSLASFGWAEKRDPLNDATLAAIAAGVSTRRYAGTLDPLPAGELQGSVSRSAVSRRFVALSAEQLAECFSHRLEELDLLICQSCSWMGFTSGSALCLSPWGSIRRGTSTSWGFTRAAPRTQPWCARCSPISLSGASIPNGRGCGSSTGRRPCGARSAISSATRRSFSAAKVHKLRNVIEHLPEHVHVSVRRAINDAWNSRDPALTLKQLERLARSLEREHPGAAGSLREGLEETLTVQRLGIDGALYLTLRSTNPIENLNGAVAHHTRKRQALARRPDGSALGRRRARSGRRRLSACARNA